MAIRKNKEIQEKSNLRRAAFRRMRNWMWGTALAIVVCGLFIMFLISKSNLPTFEELENPDIDYASAIYSDDGTEFGRYFVENRVAIDFDSLNVHLVDALISTEDARYFQHSGIDFQALVRVLVKTVIFQQKSSGGGSTITQQLAKQLYSSRDFSGMGSIKKLITLVNYKLKEWVTALKLERSYTKEEIIAMYLNNYDFIYGARGVQAAAETYFGKDQSDLTIDEAAMLVGMLKNSVLYNPKRFNENAKQRRNVVLSQMVNHNHITEVQFDSLSQKPLDVSQFTRADQEIKGDAIYFRSEVAQFVNNLIEKNNIQKPNGQLYNIHRDGLKVFTTINLPMQRILQDAVKNHMAVNQKRFFREWAGKDPWTYKYDNYPIELKTASLESSIHSTERYFLLQHDFLGDDIAAIQNSFDINLKVYDLDRMVRSAKEDSYLISLEKNNLISESKANIYRQIIRSDLWQPFLSDYQLLNKKVADVFNKKVKMTVFTYENESFEKDTVMTPLDSIKYHQMILQAGSVAIDPANGHVKAYVGGVNHKYFKYNHADASRQVGSTFKPFLYATAIALQGFSPCFPVLDIQYSISPGEGNFKLIDTWSPKNATGEFKRENYTLRQALKESKNSVSVFLLKQMGDVRPLRGIVHNMGIDSSARLANGRYKVPKQPSIVLGSTDLTPLEMTAAYATFSNNGTYNKPIFITKILDRNGKVLYEAIPKSQAALSEKVNYVMVKMLEYAGSYIGRTVKSPHGGKTGTTDEHTDGWYIGITPSIVVGTWVGGEDRWIRFQSLTYGQGSQMARPMFAEFLQELEKHPETGYDPSKQFPKPKDDIGIILDCDEYEKYSNKDINNEFFPSGTKNKTESESDGGGFFEN